jgi:hypothetical protein
MLVTALSELTPSLITLMWNGSAGGGGAFRTDMQSVENTSAIGNAAPLPCIVT